MRQAVSVVVVVAALLLLLLLLLTGVVEASSAHPTVAFGAQRNVFDADTSSTLAITVDLDDNGSLDVLSLDGRVVWSNNTDGAVGTFDDGEFVSGLLPGGEATSAVAVDIDGDGALDVVSGTSANSAYWNRHLDGRGTFGPNVQITGQGGSGGIGWVSTVDINNDGVLDVALSFTSLSFMLHSGAGVFGPRVGLSGVCQLAYPVDINGDGFVDFACAHNSPAGDVSWLRNLNGTGSFERLVVSSATGSRRVVGFDLDGDADADLLAATGTSNAVVWYPNLDGGGAFGSASVLSATLDNAWDVWAADIDGDGDLDVLALDHVDTHPILWFENLGGGTFGPQLIIDSAATFPDTIRTGDVDNDGNVDIVVASDSDLLVTWQRNYPRQCGDLPGFASGSWSYVFQEPKWVARAACEPGFGLFNTGNRTCGSASTWDDTSIPTCVFNATALVLSFPTLSSPAGLVVDVGATVPFEIDTLGSPGVGTSTLSVSINGAPAVVVPSSFSGGIYTSSWVAPQGASDNVSVSFFVDGQLLLVSPFKAIPGVVVPVPRPTLTDGALRVTRGDPTAIRIELADVFGNPVLPVGSGSPGAVLPSLPRNVTVTAVLLVQASGLEATIPLQVAEPLAGDEGLTAQLVVATTVVGAHTVFLTANGVPVPGSSFEIESVCPAGTAELSDDCVPLDCNDNSIRVELNTTSLGVAGAQCVCSDGFYASAVDGNGVPECSGCPPGAECVLGLGPPRALPGWYPVSNVSFVQCKRVSACVGGSGSPCARGYSGYMCNTCEPGFYSNGASDCVRCPKTPDGVLGGALVALVVLSGGVGVAVAVSLGSSGPGAGAGDLSNGGGGDAKVDPSVLRRRVLPASPSMVLVTFQVLGVLANFRVGWTSSAQSALNVFNVANIDVNLFASECSLSSFHVKYVMSVVLPCVMLGLAMVSAVLVKVFAVELLGEVSVRAVKEAVLFAVAPLLYIPMARATFVLFDCSQLHNGDYVVDVDPGVACFDGPWFAVLPVGLVGLVGFVVGVPLYFLMCMVLRRHKLMTRDTFARYGPLYRLYRGPYYWGGVAELAKRLAVVTIAVFFSDHVLLQIVGFFALFGGSAFVVKSQAPYFYPLYNAVDVRLSAVVFVLLVLGAGFYGERGTAASGTKTALFVGVVLALVGLAGIAVHALVVELGQIVGARSASYSASRERAQRLAAMLELERVDMDPDLAAEVGQWVARLETQADATELQAV